MNGKSAKVFITGGSTALFSNEKKAALELVAALEKNLEAAAATRLCHGATQRISRRQRPTGT